VDKVFIDKVRLYSRIGRALIDAKQPGVDPLPPLKRSFFFTCVLDSHKVDSLLRKIMRESSSGIGFSMAFQPFQLRHSS
jgi:hypothetical protein